MTLMCSCTEAKGITLTTKQRPESIGSVGRMSYFKAYSIQEIKRKKQKCFEE